MEMVTHVHCCLAAPRLARIQLRTKGRQDTSIRLVWKSISLLSTQRSRLHNSIGEARAHLIHLPLLGDRRRAQGLQ